MAAACQSMDFPVMLIHGRGFFSKGSGFNWTLAYNRPSFRAARNGRRIQKRIVLAKRC